MTELPPVHKMNAQKASDFNVLFFWFPWILHFIMQLGENCFYKGKTVKYNWTCAQEVWQRHTLWCRKQYYIKNVWNKDRAFASNMKEAECSFVQEGKWWMNATLGPAQGTGHWLTSFSGYRQGQRSFEPECRVTLSRARAGHRSGAVPERYKFISQESSQSCSLKPSPSPLLR